MPAPLFDPHGIDVINAVLIPVVIAIAAGIPLAIYTGLVASKMQWFNQTKTDALNEYVRLLQALMLTKSAAEISVTFATFWQAQKTALLAQGQYSAYSELERLGSPFLDKLNSALHGQLTETEAAAGLDELNHRRWARIVLSEEVGKAHADDLFVRRLTALKPDYAVIFDVPTFDRWLRRSDCGNCCAGCKRTL